MTSFETLGGWPGVLSEIFHRNDLTTDAAAAVFGEILEGRANPAQIAAFAAGLRTKGETVDEITGLLAAMRAHGESVDVKDSAIDTCGTGGDRSGTINVSTGAALVIAATGLLVLKHGGRAASSQAGSADVLEALGVAIELGPRGVERCLDEVGIGFCFAPRFHPAMRHAVPVRRELGVATIFNFLGPLANPGRVKHQVIGISDPSMADKMLGVLEANGVIHAMVLFGHDGLDELSTVTGSTIIETISDDHGAYVRRALTIDPLSLGLAQAEPGELIGGNAAANADRLRAILSGEPSRQRDLVALNAAAGLVVGDHAPDLEAGLQLANKALDSGRGLDVLDRLIAVSQRAAKDGLV